MTSDLEPLLNYPFNWKKEYDRKIEIETERGEEITKVRVKALTQR